MLAGPGRAAWRSLTGSARRCAGWPPLAPSGAQILVGLRPGLAPQPPVAGARVAGARVAGARVAGARVAGARVAGARVAGARVAGPRGLAPRGRWTSGRPARFSCRWPAAAAATWTGLGPRLRSGR